MISVRPAVPDDLEAVFRLATLLSERFVIQKVAFTEAYSEALESEDVYLRIAVEGDQVTGYLLGWDKRPFYSNGRVGWVQEIVVLPECRRAGVGRILVTDFEQWVSGRGGVLVSLATRGARDFYLNLGYVESATYYRKTLGQKLLKET